MEEEILLGRGHQIVSVPRREWEKHLVDIPQHQKERLSFMSPDHHRVRNYVVKQLPIVGTALAPETIARELVLPLARVRTILDELEQKLFFLVRNPEGSVTWAFPVTVEPTPHRLTFSTGQQIYAA